MSKLLKKIVAAHRPHIAARMTKEHGYDETKHLQPKDLHKAGIINKDELSDLDDCLNDLVGAGHNGASALRAAARGDIGKDKVNDDAFIKSLMALDSDTGPDADSDDDEAEDDDLADDGDPLADDDKVTA